VREKVRVGLRQYRYYIGKPFKVPVRYRLFEAALERPEFNVSQKLGFYRELKKLERDRYIAIVAEHLD